MGLSNQAVLITGAAGGIGSALCQIFKRGGYLTIGVDLPGKSCSADHCIEGDLLRFTADEEFRKKLISQIKDALSGLTLTAVVNNAAVQIVKPFEQLTKDDWETTLSVNLLTAAYLTQDLCSELSQHSGSVVNISSIHANLTKSGFVAYATSKAAILGLTKSLAVELAPQVRVNAILPAAIDTEMLREGFKDNDKAFQALAKTHPTERIGAPEEVAELALFLASKKAEFITGGTYTIDGAISSRLHDPA